jgi:hypothetical protein
VPNEDIPIEELRRWSAGEDALQEAVRSMQQFDFDAMRAAIDRAKGFCADA